MEPEPPQHLRRGAEAECRVSADAFEAVSGDLAAATRRAYATRLRLVETALDGAPLADSPLAEVLAAMAARGPSPSTLAQTVAAVRCAARRLGEPDPVGPQCGIALRAHRRAAGPSRQAAGVDWSAADDAADIAARRGDAIGLRNAAIVAVMSDALLRVSETSALDVADIARAGDGAGHVCVRRSKTDQEGVGASLFLRRATIARVDAWLRAASIDGGPLFRRVRKGGHVTADRLTARAVRAVITHSASAVGIDGASGHSLRIGSAQSLVRAGAQLPEAMLAGRWTTPAMLSRYAEAELAAHSAVARLRPDNPTPQS